jgi:CDP-diglyceride synthetase
MDESDELEPEGQQEAEPITERVRIYGAEPAGALAGTGSSVDEPEERDRKAEPTFFDEASPGLATEQVDAETLFAWRRTAPEASDSSSPTSGQVPRYLTEEPSGSRPLPHWTEPPTGQVPAIVDRRAGDSDIDPLATGGGPSWREHDHEWDDDGFDAAFLADDESRLGALDDRSLEERRPWEFDDLTPSGRVKATGRRSGQSSSADESRHGADADTYRGEGRSSSQVADARGSRQERTGWWETDTEEVRIDEQLAPTAYSESRHAESRRPQVAAESASSTHVRTLAGDQEELPDHYGRESEASHYPEVEGRVTEPVRVRAGVSSVADDEQAGIGETVVATISSSPLRRHRGEETSHTRRHARTRRPPARSTDRPADGRRRPPGTGAGRSVPLAVATGVGFALVALLCFAAGALATLVLSTVVVALAAAECYAALRRSGRKPATLLGLVATVAAMVSVYAKGVPALPLVLVLLIMTSMIWYVVGAENGPAVEGIATTVFAFAWVGILGAFAGLMLAPSQYPHDHGVAFLLGAVVATVGADVGALVVGRGLGRHPMAARVSPNKTWEGFIGGAVVAVAASVVITGHVHPWTVEKAAVLGVVVAVLAPIGDLCESLIKRDLGLKDMGSLLPGHGGVLDRVDALLFVLPATYYLVRILHLG